MTTFVNAKEATRLTDRKVKEAEEFRLAYAAKQEKRRREDVIKAIYEATQRKAYYVKLTFIRPESISDSLKQELLDNGYRLSDGESYPVTTLSSIGTYSTVQCYCIIVRWGKEDV